MRWLLIVLGLASLAHSAETYVVSSGVEQYDDARITPLRYAVADAVAVAAAFRAAGVPQRNITVLTSDQPAPAVRPVRVRIIAALQAVRDQAVEDDRLVVFFAGHGVQENGQQYLLTCDSRRDLVEDTALPMSLVSKALRGLRAREVLFIIDACRNNPDAARGDTDARMTDGLARGMRPRIVTDAPDSLSEATLLSCEVGQRAYENPEAGHGAFTVALLNGLRGQASDDEGVVRLSRLAEYVKTAVSQWAVENHRQQTPTLINPQSRDMELLRPSPEPLVSVAFEAVPLSTVARRLSQDYGVRVALSPKADSAARITGRLERLPMGLALQALVAAYGLEVHRLGTAYLVATPGEPIALPAAEQAKTPADPPAGEPSTLAASTGPAAQLDPKPPAVEPEPQAPAPLGQEASSSDPKPTGWPLDVAWPPATDPALRYRVSPKDLMPQVLIPAGTFTMGSRLRPFEPDEQPCRTITVSEFWMDLHEVTNGQYARYVAETGVTPPLLWSNWRAATGPRHPAVNLTWSEAAAYAEWAGRQLPTEAQWERAARAGSDTLYPWGGQPDASKANGAWQTAKVGGGSFGDAVRETKLVGCYPPNAFGLYDMIGNVWEWCADYYDPWYPAMPDLDPVNTRAGPRRVVRGGSWACSAYHLRCANRDMQAPERRLPTQGFRCAQAP